MDANFGLCRKKAAGTSVHDPLSKTAMFFNQSEVNQFVDNYSGANSETPSVSIYLNLRMRDMVLNVPYSRTILQGKIWQIWRIIHHLPS